MDNQSVTHMLPPIDRSNQFASSQGTRVVGLVCVLCVALGVFFCFLQDTFYSHHQPFFDSLSYHNDIHRVMLAGQQEGVEVAIGKALRAQSTVFVPNFLAAVVSPIFKPSRNFGVWLQMAELLVLVLSLFCYFRIVRQATPWASLILVSPFLLTACLYESRGGVSDFRMDLSLYLMYSISCVWYLIASATRQNKHFVLLGASIALTCLFRATAPVYLILALIPIIITELMLRRDRSKLLRGLCVAVVVATAGAIWFYVRNFDYLHYYYFVWNTDANAKLPLSESVRHIEFAFDHVGEVFLYWLIVMNILHVAANQRLHNTVFRAALFQTAGNAFRRTDARLIWLAIAPIGLLVLRGAGLNAFVSMPATFGLVLYLSSSLTTDYSWFEYRPTKVLAGFASMLAVVAICHDSWKDHQVGQFNSMSAHKRTIEQIVADAKREGLVDAAFDSSHMFYLHTYSLEATMRFDLPRTTFEGGDIRVDGVRLNSTPVFSRVVARAIWNELKGTKEQKLERLAADAGMKIDYLILPSQRTAEYLEEHVGHNVINLHQCALRSKLLASNQWLPIGDEIKNGQDEVLQLYKNQKRIELAKQQPNYQNVRR